MDLRGTDFVVSPGMLWKSIGNNAVHRVDISPVIFRVFDSFISFYLSISCSSESSSSRGLL